MRLDTHSGREILKANFAEYQKASKKGRKELPDRLAPEEKKGEPSGSPSAFTASRGRQPSLFSGS
jgi:ribosomal protein L34